MHSWAPYNKPFCLGERKEIFSVSIFLWTDVKEKSKKQSCNYPLLNVHQTAFELDPAFTSQWTYISCSFTAKKNPTVMQFIATRNFFFSPNSAWSWWPQGGLSLSSEHHSLPLQWIRGGFSPHHPSTPTTFSQQRLFPSSQRKWKHEVWVLPNSPSTRKLICIHHFPLSCGGPGPLPVPAVCWVRTPITSYRDFMIPSLTYFSSSQLFSPRLVSSPKHINMPLLTHVLGGCFSSQPSRGQTTTRVGTPLGPRDDHRVDMGRKRRIDRIWTYKLGGHTYGGILTGWTLQGRRKRGGIPVGCRWPGLTSPSYHILRCWGVQELSLAFPMVI